MRKIGQQTKCCHEANRWASLREFALPYLNALSILGNNTASLVGVAISASLLPPAVNSGICFAHGILIRAGAVSYPNSDDYSFGQIGGISFLLTVVNIVCIWISGIVMFKIKVCCSGFVFLICFS